MKTLVGTLFIYVLTTGCSGKERLGNEDNISNLDKKEEKNLIENLQQEFLLEKEGQWTTLSGGDLTLGTDEKLTSREEGLPQEETTLINERPDDLMKLDGVDARLIKILDERIENGKADLVNINTHLADLEIIESIHSTFAKAYEEKYLNDNVRFINEVSPEKLITNFYELKRNVEDALSQQEELRAITIKGKERRNKIIEMLQKEIE